ncbi:hypothetical protein M0R45_008672 [Rubus argutus]|uniref:Endonuclease/exonuclease/phosphatase domain-containing protein n=1 Tax=Rubus argutus TaxID=59490 RepID=A0AAW1Y569_RUBAR
MEILAWNCRGLYNDSSVQALITLIQQKCPSFIFLCETKVRDRDYMDQLRLRIGYMNCEAVFSVGQSGGLAMFWGDGLDWRLTGFYGHPTTVERHRTWTLLRSLSDESSLPWVVVGDFNKLLHASKKVGGNPSREGQMQLFRDALSYCDLFESSIVVPHLVFVVDSRLDRVVASSSWCDIFTHARVLHLPPIHGDHLPILLGTFYSPLPIVRKRFRFRFESGWLQNEACDAVVHSGWTNVVHGRPMSQVMQKVTATRLSLLQWQRNSLGVRKREIELIRSRFFIGC